MTKKSYPFFSEERPLFFNNCFDKGQLKNLIRWFLDSYGENITIDFLEKLKQIGFHQATLAGISLGLDDLQIPTQKPILISEATAEIQKLRQDSLAGNITSVENSQRMIDTWNQTSEFLRQNAIQQFRTTNPVNPVYMMAFSGARGNISQVRQLVAMRGLMADPQGVILEFPIQSNFREGLTITEYLISCYGARKGLVDTALRTATSGYLTRRLVDAVQHVVVTMIDCKTTNSISLTQPNLENRLIGRVIAENLILPGDKVIFRNQLISPPLAKLLASNYSEVSIRSPLTCEAYKSVCQLCYGWNLAYGTLVNLGEAVGVIAAQSIGEPGTQLTMRTFHTGGVGVFSEQAMKPILAPFDGKIKFSRKLTGLFVRTPHGKIVYMLKYSSSTLENKLLQIYSLQNSQTRYSITEKELPTGSILWVRQGEFVKTNQLIAQSSKIKQSKQKMPESSHPVFSPLEGQIYFESLRILKHKKVSLKQKKRKNKQEEIGPEIRTLKNLGSFWVFSAQIQKDSENAKTFLRPGDLVSSDTSLFQSNFYISKKTQLVQVSSKLFLTQNVFNFPVSLIRFHKSIYSFITPGPKKQIFFYKKQLKKGLTTKSLIWYPFTKKDFLPQTTFGEYTWSNLSSGKKVNFKPFSLYYCWVLPTSLVGEKKHFSSNGIFNSQKHQNELEKNLKNNFYSLEYKLKSTKNLDTLLNKFLIFNLKKTNTFIFTKQGYFKLQSKIQYFDQNNSDTTVSFEKINSGSTRFLIKKAQIRIKTGFDQESFFSFQIVKNCCDKLSFSNQSFLLNGLNSIKCLLFPSAEISLIEEKPGWIYIPERNKVSFSAELLNNKCLDFNQEFNRFTFSNSSVSLKLISSTNSRILLTTKSFTCKTPNKKSTVLQSFCSSQHEILSKESFKFSPNLQKSNNKKTWSAKTNLEKNFLFYNYKSKIKNSRCSVLISPILSLKKKIRKFDILFFQKLSKPHWPNKREFLYTWSKINSQEKKFKVTSPCFTKQCSTLFGKKSSPHISFSLQTPSFSQFLVFEKLLKVNINVNIQNKSSFNQIRTSFLLSTKKEVLNTKFSGMNLGIYHQLNLKNFNQFQFKTFSNRWVIPNRLITNGLIKIRTHGEFRQLKTTSTQSISNIFTSRDLVTLKIPSTNFLSENRQFHNEILETNNQLFSEKTNSMRIGSVLRCGSEIFPGIGIPYSGQIIKKTSETITLRKGIPILASAHGILHIFHGDLVTKNQLLVTLKSRRLQTEDIVQGIPKIEQLFEARETQGGEVLSQNVHTQLKTFFLESLQTEKLSLAVPESILKIQAFLIENILDAYANQGVKISEKHVEIIVRQMTNRVRILNGGDTGLLQGELVQLLWIQELNKQLRHLGHCEATYEPIVLGISKSVLQSESFLLAASFQEVSRVLVRSALSRKTDFLRGLHENVILGQLVPAGTGLLAQKTQ